ncbi:hypothetical protein BDP27DRAFT_770737 [Rhodocollybia butyracea]|uniref:Uncharacterized protein n=1 Tax=Rhodocollybia butyracea TaxID=206335 RepID=A0A9P5P1V0_9AGAR|nr:hypothetical protein BDP27DRAFT_770737 [Rhodocollybia butyracea]
MSGRVQHGSSTGSEALNDRNVPTGGSPLSLQGTENPVPSASTIFPLAPSYQRDVSFRSSHVEGSSSTHSNVDNSIKENFNNTTHYHFHFAPGNGVPPPLPGPSPGYQTPTGLNTHGGNGGHSFSSAPTYGSDTSVYDGYDGANRDLTSHGGGNRNNYSGGYEERNDDRNYDPYGSQR